MSTNICQRRTRLVIRESLTVICNRKTCCRNLVLQFPGCLFYRKTYSLKVARRSLYCLLNSFCILAEEEKRGEENGSQRRDFIARDRPQTQSPNVGQQCTGVWRQYPQQSQHQKSNYLVLNITRKSPVSALCSLSTGCPPIRISDNTGLWVTKPYNKSWKRKQCD